MEEKIEVGKIWENCSKLYSMIIDNKRNHLFYATTQHQIKVYDLKNNFIIQSLKGHQDSIWVLKVSNDGSYLLSGGSDGMVLIWDLNNSFKRVQSFLYGKNVHAIALGPLNRNLYVAGSGYKKIKRIYLKNILKSSPEEFNKTLELKRLKGQLSKKNLKESHSSSSNKDSGIPKILEFSEDNLYEQKAVAKAIKGYESWIQTLEKSDQEKVKALILKSVMLEEQFLKFKVDLEENNMSDILKRNSRCKSTKSKNLENQSSKYSTCSNDDSEKSFNSELVEMFKKHNIVLNEKKILKKLIVNMMTETEALNIQKENHEQMVSRLLEENEKLKSENNFLKEKNSNFIRILKTNKDRSRLLNMKNKENLRFMSRMKNELKNKSAELFNWKKISKEFEREVTTLKKKLLSNFKNESIVKILEQKNVYQKNYINILERENFKLKIKKPKPAPKKTVHPLEFSAKFQDSFGIKPENNKSIVFDTFQLKSIKSDISENKTENNNFFANQTLPIEINKNYGEININGDSYCSKKISSSKKTLDKYWKAETLPLKHKSIMKRRSNSLTSIMKPRSAKKKKIKSNSKEVKIKIITDEIKRRN